MKAKERKNIVHSYSNTSNRNQDSDHRKRKYTPTASQKVFVVHVIGWFKDENWEKYIKEHIWSEIEISDKWEVSHLDYWNQQQAYNNERNSVGEVDFFWKNVYKAWDAQ